MSLSAFHVFTLGMYNREMAIQSPKDWVIQVMHIESDFNHSKASGVITLSS